jgi:photosystem II stability/assembly factor-like uncharacterized protein
MKHGYQVTSTAGKSMTGRVRGARRRLAAAGLLLAAVATIVAGSVAAGSPAKAASAEGSASVPATAGTTRAAVVPAGFRANSLSWLTPQRGWVLGEAACGPGTCSYVIGTANGGKTWHETGQVRAPIATPATTGGVSEVRFATARTGWAFGPDLFRTTDGGRTWSRQPVPGHGKQVLSLATGPLGTYAVVSPCAWGTGLCSQQPLSLWRSLTPAGGVWVKVPLNLPANISADVAVHGATVYVVDPVANPSTGKESFYASTLAGLPGTFAARPVPCDIATDVLLTQVVPVSARRVAMLCVGNATIYDATKSVYVSDDTGRTDRYAGTTGLYGIGSQLAASPSGNLAVASVSRGSYMYINDGHGTAWTEVINQSDNGGIGWNDITYVTGNEAWVVYAPADAAPGSGELMVTRDGGRTWQQVSL